MIHNLNACRARTALACVPLAALARAAKRLQRLPDGKDLAAGCDEAIRRVIEARAAVRLMEHGNTKEGSSDAA